MLVVPELEREVELLWELRGLRKVSFRSFHHTSTMFYNNLRMLKSSIRTDSQYIATLIGSLQYSFTCNLLVATLHVSSVTHCFKFDEYF